MIDLHVHLDGSLSEKTIQSLAKMQDFVLPSDFGKLIKASSDCKDLNEYLKCFELPLKLLQTKKALKYAVSELIYELKKQGLFYAEIRFAPQLHASRWLTQKDVVRAVLAGKAEAEKNCSLKCGIILCLMRGADNEKANTETVELAAKFKGKGVAGIDLAGAEALYNTKNFETLIKTARSKDLNVTVHAGEADGPESVWAAVNAGAQRIGHGVRAIEDLELIKVLIEKRIVLEMCPTSNVQTKTVKSFKEHPIKKLFDMGVKVTVNTDNMTVSDTTLRKEVELLKTELEFTDKQINQLFNNAMSRVFLMTDTNQ